MGSFIGYTVYPVDGVSPTELQELLGSELDDPRIKGPSDDPQWVPLIISENRWFEPQNVELGGAIGQRVSPQGEDPRRFQDVIVNWLRRCADHIAVAFILNYNDTSEAGDLSAYRVEDGQLQQVRSEMVRYEHDSEKGPWPEGGARLYSHDYHTMETDRTVDLLSEFEAEFGYRPITFYG